MPLEQKSRSRTSTRPLYHSLVLSTTRTGSRVRRLMRTDRDVCFCFDFSIRTVEKRDIPRRYIGDTAWGTVPTFGKPPKGGFVERAIVTLCHFRVRLYNTPLNTFCQRSLFSLNEMKITRVIILVFKRSVFNLKVIHSLGVLPTTYPQLVCTKVHGRTTKCIFDGNGRKYGG